MIAVTVTLRLSGRRETLALSLPNGATVRDALACAGLADSGEHVFTVRAACLLYPDEPLADGDGLIVLPAMLGG